MTTGTRSQLAAHILLIVTGTVSAFFFAGTLAATSMNPYHHDAGPAVLALACFGGLVGFWFTWTGRFARLFRKV